MEEFKACTYNHTKVQSSYPRDEVPVKLFLKNPDDPNSKNCVTCYDCRLYKRRYNKKEKKISTDPNFRVCSDNGHSLKISGFEKDKVPVNLFLKIPSDPNSRYLKACFYCRDTAKIRSRNIKSKLLEEKKLMIDSEFDICTSNSHSPKKSPYSKDRIPKKFMLENPEDPNSGVCQTCFHCRVYNRTPVISLNEDPNFKSCVSSHKVDSCPFPIDKIPIHLFLKNPDDPKSKICKKCIFCRNREKQYGKNFRQKSRAIHEQNIISINMGEEFIICPCVNHGISGSQYPFDKVPLNNFARDINDPDSDYRVTCIDCRIYIKEKHKERMEKKIADAKLNGKCFCKCCEESFEECEMGKNLDDSQSKYCISCKEYNSNYHKKRKAEYVEIKFNMMIENGCGCMKCKKIFIKPEEDSIVVKKIETYIKDEERFMMYEEKEYSTKDFLNLNKHNIEFSVIQFDHLTEEELKKSGNLKEGDKYVPKIKEISKMRSRFAKIKESKKCQILCVECHVKETISRERGYIESSISRRKKREYVNKIKEKGCTCCGFVDAKFFRFFDMDHLDPLKKIATVSEMVHDIGRIYSFDELKNECDGCRVLCKMCHAVHTRQQHERGMFIYSVKDKIYL